MALVKYIIAKKSESIWWKKVTLSNSREEITLFKDQPLILRSLNAFPQDEEINSCVFVLCNNAYKPTPINYMVDI